MQSGRMFSWDEAQHIRQMLSDGVTQTDLADRYGVTQSTIWQISDGQTYRTPERLYRTDAHVGCTGPMTAMPTECVQNHYSGQKLSTWLARRGCDQRTINQITARRFQYGSYRPSDRAALLLDCNPELTPYASDDVMAAD